LKYTALGGSDLEVSRLCLGTMTWGEQNSEADAHAQMDVAVGEGINFFDAAEMYPVPPRAQTQGRTEQYIGTWLKKRGKRDDLVIATKVTGPAEFSWLRGGPRLDRQSVIAACEDSLRRLQIECIDLYQVHWPERPTNYFGRLGYRPADDSACVPIEETLGALAELKAQGKIRHVGISNESAWGLGEYLRLHREKQLPRVVSIQNPYNLLNRSFEIGLAEFAHREDVGLLAYSPLAFGVLSGKYLEGARPVGSRLTLFTRFQRYTSAEAESATREYAQLAEEHSLDPAQMALAFVATQPFVASTIIGQTTMAQLRANIAGAQAQLSPEIVAALEKIHRRHTIPCP
jgi:aryl-alcohol dehydrogenase-like predicted oxidoreductase